MSDKVFTLESAGPGNYVRIQSGQLNARSIGRVFNVFPQSVFLVADDGSVIPDEDGNLNVDNMDASFVWTCDGDSSRPAESAAGTSLYGSPFAYQPLEASMAITERKTRNRWAPKFNTSMLRAQNSGQHANEAKQWVDSLVDLTWTKNIEICSFEGSDVKKLFTLPISLTEKSASVSSVSKFVSQEGFEGHAVVLLDSENLKIPDTFGTCGKISCSCL